MIIVDKEGILLKNESISMHDFKSSLQDLAGVNHENFSLIEKELDVTLKTKNNNLIIEGEETQIDLSKRVLFLMDKSRINYGRLSIIDLPYLIKVTQDHQDLRFAEVMNDILTRTFTGQAIRPRTLGQKQFIDCIKSHDLSFAVGPAGTGKTFLAVAYGVELLKKHQISKIILTRPAVEAGENLGFLPGDLKEKVDPYLRPLYDALDTMLGAERMERYIDKGIIEIAPLAYMRGRTLDDALIILDEAQNTTKAQMMMFLSRLGRQSKMIVNGDIQQIDLPKYQESGLVIAERYLKGVEGVAFSHLKASDIVRHPLVSKILERFEKGQEEDQEKSKKKD